MKQPIEKRDRLPRSDLLTLLFTEFSRYPYWTLKNLALVTQQPLVWLKEVVNEVGVLNKRGPYANMYSLKPEYAVGGEERRQDGNGNGNEERRV